MNSRTLAGSTRFGAADIAWAQGNATMNKRNPAIETDAIMPMSEVLGATPYYVLMDGNHRIGPTVVPLLSGIECSPIYGFSNKDAYDRFCMNSRLALTPYPLIKGYLRNQASAPGDGLKLLAIDAAGPRSPYLHAATMEAVFEAQENRMTHVSAAYRLMFDQQAEAYRVEEVSESAAREGTVSSVKNRCPN